MTGTAAWFSEQCAGAPGLLRARAAAYLEAAPIYHNPPDALAGAAAAALRDTLAHQGDRSIALNLLAADALVTLALLATAQRDPGGLARFAARLREAGAAIR